MGRFHWRAGLHEAFSAPQANEIRVEPWQPVDSLSLSALYNLGVIREGSGIARVLADPSRCCLARSDFGKVGCLCGMRRAL